MRIRDIMALLERSLDPFVHGSVAADEAEASRHRGFIATRFLSGVLALALLPPMLALDSSPGLAAAALGLLGVEALVALHVSRTGRIEAGHLLSAGVLTATVALVAAATGGLSSFALPWFAVAPIEASLSGRRKVIGRAAVVGSLGFAAVAAAAFAGMLPAAGAASPVTGALSGVVALVYAATVAFRVDAMHRATTRRLETNEARYRLLAETMTDMVTGHGADGDVLFASPAAERLLDVKPRTVTGEGLFRRVHVADRPAYLTALSSALHKGAGSAEFRLRSGDLDDADSWTWVEMRLSRADGTCPWPVVGVTRDIGRHKAQEAELDRARQEAEIASFAKTRFLASMSHEFRTPLNAIIGFSDILSLEMFGKLEYERHREYSRLIKDAGEHLLQVVNDILDVSKIEAGSLNVKPEPLAIRPIIERCRDIMMPQAAEAGVDLVLVVDEKLPELQGDRRACRQILLNLMSNAVKFSHRGGRVECGARREGRYVALSVKDSGIGIPAGDLPQIGNPFVQGENACRSREGAGLGLSVVKGLAALHGGSMRIESAVGVGTTVTVLLPVVADAVPTALAPRAKTMVGADNPGAVLAMRA